MLHVQKTSYKPYQASLADEIFSGNVASEMALGEAWARKIIPLPHYITGLYDFKSVAKEVAEKISKTTRLSDEEKSKRLSELNKRKVQWQRGYGMSKIIAKHLPKDAKRVLVFYENIASTDKIVALVEKWFSQANIQISSISSLNSGHSKNERKNVMEDFKDDKGLGSGVKLLFSVNILNEGVHVPSVDALIFLRKTKSPIIFLQQMGRCLSAGESHTPVVFDMVDNIAGVNYVGTLKSEYKRAVASLMDEEKHKGHEYKPEPFIVTDYLLDVRNQIDKISRLRKEPIISLSYEEKVARMRAFIAEKSRLPSKGKDSEEDVYIWKNLLYCHRTKEVEDLWYKYVPSLNVKRDIVKKRIIRFVEKEKRWMNYKEELEISEYGIVGSLCKQDNEVKECYEKTHPTDIDGKVMLIERFLKYHNRLPHADEGGIFNIMYALRKVTPTKTTKILLLRIKRLFLSQKIEKANLYFIEIENFVEKYGRLPCASRDGNIIVNQANFLRNNFRDSPRYQEIKRKLKERKKKKDA